jgi:hypothetical protein
MKHRTNTSRLRFCNPQHHNFQIAIAVSLFTMLPQNLQKLFNEALNNEGHQLLDHDPPSWVCIQLVESLIEAIILEKKFRKNIHAPLMIFYINHQITQQLLLQFALMLLQYYIYCSLLHPTNPLCHQLRLAKLNNQPNELNANN